jgi:hypothetical protein
MSDRYALPLLAFIAMAMIALALVWPQGQGRPSPALLGHPAPPLVGERLRGATR